MSERYLAGATALILFGCWAWPAVAQEGSYWSIEIPVPESATNPAEDVDRQFLMKSVSFDWEGEDTTELREFYGSFFTSLGWEDLMAGSKGLSTSPGAGWASYSMNFDDQNQPVASYGSMWKATKYPAFGTVTVRLTEYRGGQFNGKVTVGIAPEIDAEVMFQLNRIVGNNPKNLFKLHNAVQGNPFEIHKVALPANFEEEPDPLLQDYYRVVSEIRSAYRQWKQDHVPGI